MKNKILSAICAISLLGVFITVSQMEHGMLRPLTGLLLSVGLFGIFAIAAHKRGYIQ